MRRRVLLAVVVLGVAVVTLFGVAWAVDRGRGVELAGRKVGDDPTQLISAVADGYDATPVIVHTPDGDLRSTAGDLGLTVDEASTRAAIADARSAGPGDWLSGLFGRRSAPLIVETDPVAVRRVVRAEDPTQRTNPVEPSIVGGADGISVRRGAPGRGLDPEMVADAVEHAARSASTSVEADVEPAPLAPRFSLADAERLAAEARRLVDEPLEVRAADVTATLGPNRLQSWVRSTEALQLDLADDEVLEFLTDELEEATVPAVDATVGIVDGRPTIVRGQRGSRCCADSAADRVLEALLDRPGTALELPLVHFDPDRTSDDLRELGIDEPIGTFTTNFAAGQSRVKNIHRIAELVDGTVIGPGGRFSVNDHVGRRTREKGFVSGGVIQNGVFEESVGGGISQFATTLFNAAFFGGLDFAEYQSHSIYISRYPYGREATLSFPKPDLVIRNDTPHGVLIDTSYTSTSVTITLWSTEYATGAQTGQSESRVGENGCKRVRTQRTRTYVDGRTEVDHVFATYRPEEGVQC